MTSPRREDLLDISFGLNEAVLNQGAWERGLQRLADGFHASFATFEVLDKSTGRHIQHHDSSDLEIQKEYLDYYVPLNPRIAFGRLPKAPRILHDHLLVSEQEMDQNEFYADFLRRHDLRYFLSFKAYETADSIGVFTIQKNASAGPATEDDLLAIKQLAPTFSRVADLQVQYSRLFARIHDFEATLEASKDGLIFLNAIGYVRELNPSAVSILQQNDGLQFVNGRLSCTDAAHDEKLRQILSNCGVEDTLLSGQSTLFVPRPSGSPPFQIRIQNISRHSTARTVSDASLLLLIRDPNISQTVEATGLMEGFGFTAAEANVALLIANGRTAGQIATQLHVSLPTIRTHIQRIMQKMSVKRQIDIARILARYN